MLNEAHITRYHEEDLLLGNLECFLIDIDFPFESHLQCRVCFPPNKFLVSFYRYYVLELVHLNLNTIAALTVFIVPCECWLGIEPSLDLFRHFYSRVSYSSKELAHTMGFNLRHHRILQ
jgi:hypothetical protein